MSASPTPPTGGSQIIAGVACLASAIAYFTVLSGFRQEGENRFVDAAGKGTAGAPQIEIKRFPLIRTKVIEPRV